MRRRGDAVERFAARLGWMLVVAAVVQWLVGARGGQAKLRQGCGGGVGGGELQCVHMHTAAVVVNGDGRCRGALEQAESSQQALDKDDDGGADKRGRSVGWLDWSESRLERRLDWPLCCAELGCTALCALPTLFASSSGL